MRAAVHPLRPHRVAALALAVAALFAAPARAGMFDDEEARKAILDLRQKLEQSAEAQRAQSEQIAQMRRSLLELNNQIELMRSDLARMRGQDEQIVRDVAELQRKQKDVQSGIDERIRKLEPVSVTLDDKTFLADPEEKRLYDDAFALIRKADFAAAAPALASFLRRFPASGFADSATFWLGNAQYGNRQYKEAMATFRHLVATHPDHPKAPEALLAVANCQVELKDAKGARKTIGDLLQQYPKSEAAAVARERLASLK
jgi:tol-pal system protein YbgF